jgi:creatinine amidohydrolase
VPAHRDRHLARMTQPEAARLLASSGAAVLATGSVEQHGPHLPLGTDAYAAMTVAERVAARLDTVVAPLGLVGVAHYHLPWGGSLSLAPATLIALFRRPDVYPVLRDFHEIAPTGWYGHPERADPARAAEVFEAVADHVVARAREIWAALEWDVGP